MELDVHLTRDGEESWGLEFCGGDADTPLTVDKVHPSSPAHAGGLQPGDVITRIGDTLAADLSLDAANELIARAVGSLAVGIYRGLYDPVLDDYDPIYDTDPGDLDRQSATEVPDTFDPDHMTGSTLNDPYRPGSTSLNNDPYRNTSTTPLSCPDFTQNGDFQITCPELSHINDFQRSLTASPFPKPYRPFSTEPLEVPALEDPIILNPDYKDELNLDKVKNDLDNVANILGNIDYLVKNKFKLPISKQYDPNYGKRVSEILENVGKEKKVTIVDSTVDVSKVSNENIDMRSELDVKVDTKQITNEINEISKETSRTEELKEEKSFTELVNTVINVESIEKTALNIVEESIDRAVSVTEEIKREVEEELRASMTRDEVETSAVKESYEKSELTQSKAEQSIEHIELQSEITNKTETSEFVDKSYAETQEIDAKKEEIHKESVKSTVSEKVDADFSSDVQYNKEIHSKKSAKETEFVKETHMNGHVINNDYVTETEFNTKQSAYKIGLQTIPNIRGMVQTSHHFDLLLRTFFIHLTDVMVALSRFILTQPIGELNAKSEKVIKENLVYLGEKVSRDTKTNEHRKSEVKSEMREEKNERVKQDVKVAEHKKVEAEQVIKKDIQEEKQITKADIVQRSEEAYKEQLLEEEYEKKRVSGAEMAQRTQRKSRELTQRMDAVITEFENKTGLEEESIRRRSRSRSRIEEEVSKESDPLDWLEKINTQTQEKTEINKSMTTIDSKKSKIEDRHVTRLTSRSPTPQMYVAIVESHVYTNKDAIVEKITEESSQITEEVIAEEAVATETAVTAKLETAKSSVETTSQLAKVTATNEATLQTAEAIKLDSAKEFKETVIDKREAALKQEMLTNIASESTELTTVSDVKVFESKETKDTHVSVVAEESYKEAASESIEVTLESTQEVTEATVTKKEATITKQELLTAIASENTDVIIDDSKHKSFETYEATTKSIKQETEENYKATALQTTNILIEEAKEQMTELKMNKQQASAKVEQLAIAVAESTDIVADDSEVKEFKAEELQAKKAMIKSEETYKTAAIETTDVALEEVIEEHTINLQKEATIREDTRHLSVAGIIETKTEICKEPQPPTYDEENAELKIVKEEIIDVENTFVVRESELNIHKSLELSDVRTNNEYFESTKEVSSKKSSSLHIKTDLETNGDLLLTPTPSTVPPTPLTDEYVFKLEIPLPKSRVTTPFIEEIIEDDDPNIVKKKLVPHIETVIEPQIIYETPLLSPTEEKKLPVYTKPGLRGGGCVLTYKEYIREIERKSSLLASAIDQTIKSIEEYKEEVGIDKDSSRTNAEDNVERPSMLKAIIENCSRSKDKGKEEEKEELVAEEIVLEEPIELPGFKPVQFNPDAGKETKVAVRMPEIPQDGRKSEVFMDESGQPIGTVQGIVDGLEEATVDDDVAKELGKPGITEEKVAEIISGESDMMREAHLMGLTRVISSHMHRPGDDEEEFQRIKPLVPSLKNSEVIKALNEEIKIEEMKKAEDKKWTTFLQKPKRAVPRPKIGCHGYIVQNIEEEEPYKVKIVKQPKPKVAPDYKPEDFDTGPLPWEERALTEPPTSPVALEDPILVPEDTPEFLEAVDPLPESEVPDLEDTGIPLPTSLKIVTVEVIEGEQQEETSFEEEEEQPVEEESVKEELQEEEMEMSVEKRAEKLVESVKGMVDPNAPIDQQLAQMRAQLAALAQLPCVIQQSLESLTRHLSIMGQQQESMQFQQMQMSSECQMMEESYEQTETSYSENMQENNEQFENTEVIVEEMLSPIEEVKEELQQPTEEELEEERRKQALIEEERMNEKQKKQLEEQAKLEQESRQIKQRPTPRVGKPKRMFGPQNPEERPLVLPGGRRWKGPKDAFNEQMFAETVQAQSELIQGKAMGINFKKYEKPPVCLDHLQRSEVYKVVHNMDQGPMKRVDFLTPVVSEADYRERCRSATPSTEMVSGRPQQFQP